jgi:hypothetical protein
MTTRLRSVRTVLPVLATAGLLTVAPAAAAARPAWMRVARVLAGPSTGLACPSLGLCVAIDSSGNASVSTAPLAGAQSWLIVGIDPGGSLSGVSCPSAGLCVAVDRAGRVLTASDPASAAASAWQSGLVDPEGLVSVSCPSVSLCVAVGGQDVAFSNDPAAGSPSWSVLHDIDRAIDYECGKYNPEGPCPSQAFTSVSCPANSLCEAIDDDGGIDVSGDPGAAGGWPPIYGLDPSISGSGDVACQSGVLCLQDCAVGEGAGECLGGRSYDAAEVIATNPSTFVPPRTQVVASSVLVGLWCTPRGCFAAPRNGGLVASADPGSAHPWWQPLLASPRGDATPSTTIAAVACPSSAACLALAVDGTLSAGPLPATVRQVHSALRATLNRTPTSLRARALTRAGGYHQHCLVPAAGTVTISWYQASSHILVARAKHSFTQPGGGTLKLALTRRGRQLITRGRLAVTVLGTFAAHGTSAIHATGHRLQIQ